MNAPFAYKASRRAAAIVAAGALAALLALGGCESEQQQATGAAFTPQTSIESATFNEAAAEQGNGAAIDASSVAQGVVSASATNQAALKFQVTSDQYTENFDLPNDGTPIVCPLPFGDGQYTFRVMQNTSGNNYVELLSTTADVSMESEFAPFLRPNVYCDYGANSACVQKARELVANASNQAEAVEAICNFMVENVAYDDDKAASLKTTTGYVPSPDDTLATGTGVCFDYASLGAAMLRSQGIPAKIVTGYVSPGDIYHAWIMVYIDGTWKSAQFSVSANTWSRVDLTFAASSGNANVGDGKNYTDRYVY